MSQPRPVSSDGPGHDGPSDRSPASPPGRAAALLSSLIFSRRARDARRDARRVTIGVIGLIVIVLALLNVVIYQNTRARMLDERWSDLTTRTQLIRDEVRAIGVQLVRDATFVAGSDEAERLVDGTGAGLNPVEELNRAERSFRFNSVRIVAGNGSTLAASDGVSAADRAADAAIVARARRSDATEVVMDPVADGGPALVIAVPIRAVTPGAIALFRASVARHLQPVLDSRRPRVHAYLVAGGENGPVMLSRPSRGGRNRVGGTITAGDPLLKAALQASRSDEAPVHDDGPTWSMTRHLPELGIGLVCETDRASMLASTRLALIGLLLLDIGTLVLLFGGLWLWRTTVLARVERESAAEARQGAERVSAVLDNAFDAIVIFDRRGTVAIANRAAERLFQRPAAEIVGEPFHLFLEWNTAVRPGAIEALELGSVSRSEILRADGQVVPVEFSLGCSGDGEDFLYTAIVRDISERVAAENRIRQIADGLEVTNRRLQEANAQLEEASRLKSEFLANTSHELRTPLNGIIGFVQLVLDGLCETPEEQRDFLRQAMECSRHLLGLINDVLDIAKIEAGKLAIEPEAVDVTSLFQEVHTLTHVQAAQKGLDLHFEVVEPCTHPVRGDFGKIKQVLVNLVGNSLKFTPRGRVTVRVIERAQLGHFMFEVIDTGVGIPRERQRIIFEKFTQADGSTTRRFGGTGLGLAICRSLVELMGGVIGVDSEGENKGTRMYFSLPIWWGAASEQGDTDVDERIEGPAGGPLILVVEDDPVFRRFLVTLLQRHGHRTLEAAHADAGWMLLRRHRPALVVIDYALSSPEGAGLRTGWDLARRMVDDADARKVPLVFVTGFESELKDKLSDTAFARKPAYLPKPVEGATLIAKIRELLGPASNRTARILLADDDPAVAAYLRKILRPEHYHVEVVNDGEECLHALRAQPKGFDLLLLDLMMPQVSGYDVLREMTFSGLAADLPVLVLTSCPEPRTEEERQLLEGGLVATVVPKPMVHANHEMLPALIQRHLDERFGIRRVADGGGGAPLEEAA